MTCRIVLGVMPNRYYLADTGEVWEGDFPTALKIRWSLAQTGVGVFAIEADTLAETLLPPAPAFGYGQTDTDSAVN